MIATLILACSIAVQLAAAIMAFRLIRLTGKSLAWSLISVALILMAIRRIIPLYHLIIGDQSITPNVFNELIGLALSCLMLLGIVLIAPLFMSVKQSEKELSKHRDNLEDEFRQLFNKMPSGVAIYEAVRNGEDFIFKDFNLAAEKIDGIAREAVVGKSVLEIFPGIKDFGLFDLFQKVWRTGKSQHFPITQYTDNRISGWRDNYVYKLPSDEIVAIYDDVTEEKKAEDTIKQLAKDWQTTFDSISDLVSIQDTDFKLVRVNKSYADTFKMKPEELIGRRCYEVVHKTSCHIENCPHEQALETKLAVTREIFEPHLDTYLEVSCSPIFNDAGELQGTIHIAKDISARKENEQVLAYAEARYRKILEEIQDSYMESDIAGNFTLVNNAACRHLGYTMEELIGKHFSIITAGKEDEAAVFAAYNEIFKTGLPHDGLVFKAKRKDGSTGFVEASISLARDKQGKQIGFRSVGRDITERKEWEQKLEALAMHDSLTGLPNRRLLNDRFNMALTNAQRNKKRLAIMSIDLDKFKIINDTLGHDTGDKLLIAVADRLTGALRKSDTIARIGGDEFVLLLGEVEQKDSAVTVAQKLLEYFRQPFTIDAHILKVTLSIGIALFPDDGKDIESLLKASDKALYAAKEKGRDRFALDK